MDSRLPIDSEEFRSQTTNFAEKAGRILRLSGIFMMELGELALSKGRDLYDWLYVKFSGNRGYRPVGQTALDDEIDSDPTLLDLDIYDEE